MCYGNATGVLKLAGSEKTAQGLCGGSHVDLHSYPVPMVPDVEEQSTKQRLIHWFPQFHSSGLHELARQASAQPGPAAQP